MQEMNKVAPVIDLGVEELETLEAPGFWDTAGGVVAGGVVGTAAVYGGFALGVALT